MPRTVGQIILEMRRQVGFTNKELAHLTGVSLRTVERHTGSFGIADGDAMRKLIVAGYRKNPGLARELAQATGHSLVALGLETSAAMPATSPAAAAPAPAPAVPQARKEHADSVLLAAANAFHQPPEDVRPALAAAFARAREPGMDPCGLAAHLQGPPAEPKVLP